MGMSCLSFSCAVMGRWTKFSAAFAAVGRGVAAGVPSPMRTMALQEFSCEDSVRGRPGMQGVCRGLVQRVGLELPVVVEAAGVSWMAAGGRLTEHAPLRRVLCDAGMQLVAGSQEIRTLHHSLTPRSP